MRLAYFSLIILVAVISCKKDNLDINSFWECNRSQNLDSTTLSVKLIGSWTWAKQSCFWEGKTKTANKNIKVTFNNNHTFNVNEDLNTLTQGTWKLVQVDVNSWGFLLSSPSNYLYGRILFCNKEVLFNDSYRDGCDNLFRKSN